MRKEILSLILGVLFFAFANIDLAYAKNPSEQFIEDRITKNPNMTDEQKKEWYKEASKSQEPGATSEMRAAACAKLSGMTYAGDKCVPNNDAAKCAARLEAAQHEKIKQCGEKKSTATKFCSPLEALGSEIDPGTAAMLQSAAGGAAGIVGAIQATGASQHEQCSKAANMAKMMGALNTGQAAGCMTYLTQCKSSCGEAADVEEAKNDSDLLKCIGDVKKRCNAYNGNFAMMAAQAMSALQNFAQSSSCAKMTAGTGFNAAALSAGAPQPIALPAAKDCSNAEYAKATPLCACLTNPRDPLCTGVSGAGGGAGGLSTADSAGGSGDRSGLTSSGADGSDAFGGGPADGVGGNGKGSSSNNTIPGGGGGGPGGGSSSAARGGGDEGGSGSPASGLNTGVIGGASTASGGGFSYGRSGAPASDDPRQALQAMKERFNLKNALPNEKDYKNRNIAGMSLSAKDGVTGPNGLSLFEKVSRKYQMVESTMLPP